MTTTTRQRDDRLDVIRGVAIVAIVLVHVVRGLQSAGLVDVAVSRLVDRSVGLWCLSVFAFVGGTFVPRSVQQTGLSAYLRDRITRLLVVYLVWSLVQGMVHRLAGQSANHRTSFGQVFEFWRPDGQLWYLPFLILVSVVFIPMRPWIPKRAPLVLLLAAVVSLLFWGYDGGYIGKQGLGLVVFFVAGMVVGSGRVQNLLDRYSTLRAAVISLVLLVVTAVVGIGTTAVPPTYYWFEATPARVASGVLLSVVATAAIVLFGQAARSVSVLAFCGRRSIDIYLGHIILASGTRVVLIGAGVANTWVIAAVSVLIGIGGSLLVATALRHVGWGWVFDGPHYRRTTAGRR